MKVKACETSVKGALGPSTAPWSTRETSRFSFSGFTLITIPKIHKQVLIRFILCHFQYSVAVLVYVVLFKCFVNLKNIVNTRAPCVANLSPPWPSFSVYLSITILAMLVEVHQRIIPVMFNQIRSGANF